MCASAVHRGPVCLCVNMRVNRASVRNRAFNVQSYDHRTNSVKAAGKNTIIKDLVFVIGFY